MIASASWIAGPLTLTESEERVRMVLCARIIALTEALAMVDGEATPQQIHGRIDGLREEAREGLRGLVRGADARRHPAPCLLHAAREGLSPEALAQAVRGRPGEPA